MRKVEEFKFLVRLLTDIFIINFRLNLFTTWKAQISLDCLQCQKSNFESKDHINSESQIIHCVA